MKAIRKLLAMALVVVMVLSMSTMVFAAEAAEPRTGCPHRATLSTVYHYEWVSQTVCSYRIDYDGYCDLCGAYIYVVGNQTIYLNHFMEEGETYCWQCRRYGCALPKS